MPIYEYRCTHCGHECEQLENVNAPSTQKCPACGQEALNRQISATHFQLKGKGWYVTDFRDSKDSNKGENKDPKTAESSPSSDNETKAIDSNSKATPKDEQ